MDGNPLVAPEPPAPNSDARYLDLQAMMATLIEQVTVLTAEVRGRPNGVPIAPAPSPTRPASLPRVPSIVDNPRQFMFFEDGDDDAPILEPARVPPRGTIRSTLHEGAAKGKAAMDDDVSSQAENTREVENLRAEFEAKALLMQQQIDLLRQGNAQTHQVDWKSGYVAAERLNIPQSLKLPSMDKYDGKRDPSVFMKTFVATMVPLRLGDDALMQLFPRYLMGAAERWYHQACGGKFASLDDLATRFIGRFSMHSMIAEPEEQLKQVIQGDRETFRSFMARWNDVAAEVDVIPSPDKMIEMVRSSLNREYATAMAARSFTTLNELITVGRSINRAAATNRF